MVVRLTHEEKEVGRSCGVHTGYSMGGGGANVKTLVTTDETKFKIFTFWTY
jgi:hypothetical protein